MRSRRSQARGGVLGGGGCEPSVELLREIPYGSQGGPANCRRRTRPGGGSAVMQ